MSTRPHHVLRLWLPIAVALIVLATPAQAGPPWISVELPANPFDRSTRGALLLVHTYHHELPARQQIACSFEGIVDGARRSRSCDVTNVDRAGTFAVRGEAPGRGVWMLVIRAGENRSAATALVRLGTRGEVVGVRVPTRREGRYEVPTPVSSREIDALLRTRWDALSLDTAPKPPTELAGMGLLALLALAMLFASSRRS